jgi:lipid-A-disaccharide synthase-like uncharacterized protein
MIVLYLILAYLIAGLIFTIPFLIKWIHAVDEATQQSPWTFKLTILPGCIVLWPVLLKKYINVKRGGRG